MISADTLARLLRYSFPIVIILTVCIVCIVSAVKNKKNGVDTTPRQPCGLRPPTDEEARGIKEQVLPRVRKMIIVTSLIFIPVTVIIFGTAISMYGKKEFSLIMVMGIMGLAFALMYIGILSLPLSELRALLKRLYSVSDCYFADVQVQWRVNPKGIPVKIYHAVIRDQLDLSWETDLTKDLQYAEVGMRCLVVIYDDEAKVNRNRANGTSLYRRTIYVPRDQFD